MPTYDYKCEDCKIINKIFHSINSDLVYTCKTCGSELKKQIGAGGGVIFKGSGFYTTDYKKLEQAQIESNTPRKERSDNTWKVMENWEKKVVAHENKKKGIRDD